MHYEDGIGYKKSAALSPRPVHFQAQLAKTFI